MPHRIKNADLIDLVSEKIDPVRIGRGDGKEVDDAAAHGEFPFVRDDCGPLVTERCEKLGDILERDIRSGFPAG